MGLTEGLVLSCEDTEHTFLRIGIDGEEKQWKKEKGRKASRREMKIRKRRWTKRRKGAK
jgi:hypothetical protein